MAYYYLLTGLQELQRDGKPMPMDDLLSQMEQQMSQSDWKQVALLAPDRLDDALRSRCRFVRDWARFNVDLNNILVADVCRRHGWKAEEHIHGELPSDIAPEMLALTHIENLYDREKAQDALRWDWLEQRTQFTYFSLENVLTYYLRCQMLHRWDGLTMEEGKRVFGEIVADMKKGVDLSQC